MIIRLCEDTPKLALRIIQPGCSGGQLSSIEGVALRITEVQCYEPQEVKVYDHCFNHVETFKRTVPSVTYPAFEVDDAGRVVFYFDAMLWGFPKGRYTAHVLLDDCCVFSFDIDLCNRPVIVDQVVQIGVAGCEENQCL